jgi:hypothetical protein
MLQFHARTTVKSSCLEFSVLQNVSQQIEGLNHRGNNLAAKPALEKEI